MVNGLDNQAFVVDLDSYTCLNCDELFFEDVGKRFMESTDYEDATDILIFFVESAYESDENDWTGFPEYMKEISHTELFDVFNCVVGVDYMYPRTFEKGYIIHPFYLEIVRRVGYDMKEDNIEIDGKLTHIGYVEKVDYVKSDSDSRSLDAIYKIEFEITLWMINKSESLCEAVNKSKQNTTVYLQDEYPEYRSSYSEAMKVAVISEKTVMAALRLRKCYPDSRIAVLNFANPIHPGGAVTLGHCGQEEELCRCTTLYEVISSNDVCGKYYLNHDLFYNTNKSSDALIYSEDIIVIKSDEHLPIELNPEDYISVDVITMAAPYCGEPVDDVKYDIISDEELFDIHVKRARHMLTVAAHKKVEVLILGAFGCGAFKNNPYVVAKAYNQVLKEFSNCFKLVEFAIPAKRNAKIGNYEIFKKELCD